MTQKEPQSVLPASSSRQGLPPDLVGGATHTPAFQRRVSPAVVGKRPDVARRLRKDEHSHNVVFSKLSFYRIPYFWRRTQETKQSREHRHISWFNRRLNRISKRGEFDARHLGQFARSTLSQVREEDSGSEDEAGSPILRVMDLGCLQDDKSWVQKAGNPESCLDPCQSFLFFFRMRAACPL